ncbi:MAG: 2-oxoglutarate ferredoxin oxidoreductase subunit alpha, partial [Acidimicrobiales bacterium]|nr:2-oxoglutarate ferredoxin oxidoreductase subunit alpha [Acidimicrobiales bacterium]
LPTKTEASDLMMALYGRHGESPMPVVAANSPSDCFSAVIEASRLALKYRTPVMLLTDGYLATGSEPWQLPDVSSLPDLSVDFTTRPNGTDAQGDPIFLPYLRDADTLARPWAVPGTAGLEHRLGGLEKENGSGNVSYDPNNHELMTQLREAKVNGIANDIPQATIDGTGTADILLVGWGSTLGSITSAVQILRDQGISVDQLHLNHLHPFASNLGDLLHGYSRILVPELNRGQLVKLLRAEFLVDATTLSKMEGLPFTGAEIVDAATALLEVTR